MKEYLIEAFKASQLLEDDFALDDAGIASLKDFTSQEEITPSKIIDMDMDMESEDDVTEEEHIDDIILRCSICQRDVFKPEEEVIVDEEQSLANVDDECPYCHLTGGFKILGKLAPFDFDSTEEESDEIHDEIDMDDDMDDDIVELDGEEDLDESLELTEKKWNYTLNAGADLRAAIDAEDVCGVLNYLEACYEELAEAGIIDEDDKNDYIAECEIIECDDEDVEDEIDYLLSDFYDLCDNLNVWVSLNESIDSTDDEDEEVEPLNEESNWDKIQKALSKMGVKENLEEDKLEESDSSWDKIQKALKRMGVTENLKESITLNDDDFVELSDGDGEEFPYIIINIGSGIIGAVQNPNERPFKSFDDIEMYYYELEHDSDFGDCSNAIPEDLKPKFVELCNDYIDIDDDTDVAESLEEDFKEASVTTDTEKMEMSTNEDGGVTITTTPLFTDEENAEDTDYTIRPLDDEEKLDVESGTDEDESDEDIDLEVGDFDEESFDELGESYLKENYSNVVSYKTTNIAQKENKLYVEGVIKFESGSLKKTSFIFEAKEATRKGNVKFLGENAQITKGKKAFTLTGSLKNGSLISEALSCNYITPNDEGRLKRVKGLYEAKLSDIADSASKIIQDHMDEINACGSVKEIVDLINSLLPEDKKKESKVATFLRTLPKNRSLEAALQHIWNFILSGDGLKSIK